MPRNVAGKRKARPVGPKPAVSNEALQKAQDLIEQQEMAKKVRDNLRYALQSDGTWDAYLEMPIAERKSWMEAWAGAQIDKGTKQSKVWLTCKTLSTTKNAGFGWEWCSKKKCVDEWGLTKFLAKKASGKLQKRADPDTGLSDDDNAEFRLKREYGSEMEEDRMEMKRKTKEEPKDI